MSLRLIPDSLSLSTKTPGAASPSPSSVMRIGSSSIPVSLEELLVIFLVSPNVFCRMRRVWRVLDSRRNIATSNSSVQVNQIVNN